mgnify:CR=1 FL=1
MLWYIELKESKTSAPWHAFVAGEAGSGGSFANSPRYLTTEFIRLHRIIRSEHEHSDLDWYT